MLYVYLLMHPVIYAFYIGLLILSIYTFSHYYSTMCTSTETLDYDTIIIVRAGSSAIW